MSVKSMIENLFIESMSVYTLLTAFLFRERGVLVLHIASVFFYMKIKLRSQLSLHGSTLPVQGYR